MAAAITMRKPPAGCELGVEETPLCLAGGDFVVVVDPHLRRIPQFRETDPIALVGDSILRVLESFSALATVTSFRNSRRSLLCDTSMATLAKNA